MSNVFSQTARRGLCLAAASLCTLSLGTASASPSHDAWLTTKAKIALLTSRRVPSTAVHVDTNDGRVLLHGKVQTQAQKDSAESIAKGIDGVTVVRNLLQVVSVSQANIVAISDERMKSQIEADLKRDACLTTGSVSVKSVDKGIVLLVGKTRNLTEYLAALQRAAMVPGVLGVQSEVTSANTLDSVDGSRPAEGAKCAALDEWITMSTKMKLIGDRVVPALAIGVDTRDGNVTLFGVVPSLAAKDAAEIDAKKVADVRSVINELIVESAEQRTLAAAKDEIVARDVKTALRSQPELKQVSVSVKDGVAHLTGKLPMGWRRLSAVTLVRSTPGVRSVDDGLRP